MITGAESMQRLLYDLLDERQPQFLDVLIFLDALKGWQLGASWDYMVGTKGPKARRYRNALLLEAADLLRTSPEQTTWELAGILAEQVSRPTADTIRELLVRAERCAKIPRTQQGLANVLRSTSKGDGGYFAPE